MRATGPILIGLLAVLLIGGGWFLMPQETYYVRFESPDIGEGLTPIYPVEQFDDAPVQWAEAPWARDQIALRTLAWDRPTGVIRLISQYAGVQEDGVLVMVAEWSTPAAEGEDANATSARLSSAVAEATGTPPGDVQVVGGVARARMASTDITPLLAAHGGLDPASFDCAWDGLLLVALSDGCAYDWKDLRAELFLQTWTASGIYQDALGRTEVLVGGRFMDEAGALNAARDAMHGIGQELPPSAQVRIVRL